MVLELALGSIERPCSIERPQTEPLRVKFLETIATPPGAYQ